MTVDDVSFEIGTFTDASGTGRKYYHMGTGRPVMVLHELTGLSPADLDFCRRLSAEGFTVYAPVLFGTPGKNVDFFYTLQCIASICISREFARRRSLRSRLFRLR